MGLLSIFLVTAHRQAIATATLTTNNLVQVLESSLADDLSRVEGVIGFVVREVGPERMREGLSANEHDGIERMLMGLEHSFENISAINLFDAKGRLLFSSNALAGAVDIGEFAYFQEMRDGPEGVIRFSEVRIAGTTGRRSLAMGRSVRTDDGRFVGVVGAIVDIDALGDLLASVDVGEGGLALLRRSDNSTLIQRFPPLNEADFNRPLPLDNPIRIRIDAGERLGTLRYTASTDGVERIASFKVLERYPFYVQVALADTYYLAGWWGDVRVVGVMALIILGAFGFAISRMLRDGRKLHRIAHFDALTDLPNRILLADRLEQAMIRAQRSERQLALAYLDLDGFKQINDQYGHDVGDALLVEVARRMRDCLRDGDTVARLGGDEFVVVLSEVRSPAACMVLIRRLIAAVDRPVTIGGLDVQVSSSVGVSFYPQREPVEAEQLLRQADQAMYQAKLAGRNRFHVFDLEQHALIRGQHQQIERIGRALKHGELVLHYQPKVNMRSGEVVGVEALLRWQHPDEGLIPPLHFLPAIEQHRLDIKVGEWVIEEALRQSAKWLAAGLRLPVSVNVSAHFLQHPFFVKQLEAVLRRHPDLPDGWLELEVLESSALSDVARASAVIDACARLGVRVALDDFGTGYSSLTYLKRLPAQTLKIDQGFVRDMLHDPDDLSILEGILGLARAFRRAVIAEGVETLEHGLLLLRLGCEFAQGYGIARPMPAAEIVNWCSIWRPDPLWASADSLDPRALALVRAGVEQRAWLLRLQHWFEERRSAVPDNDPQRCRCCDLLQQWASGAEGDAMTTLRLHRQMHEIAGALVAHRVAGEKERAGRCLTEARAVDARFAAQVSDCLRHGA